MRSLSSHMFYLIMRYRHLFQGKLRREAWDENTSVQAFRDLCEQTNERLAKLPDGVTVEAVDVDGLYAEWIVPAGGDRQRVILYTIGGGYVSGSCKDHRSFVAKLSAFSRTTVLLFEHRLAPEHPYPAAVDDTLTAYRRLLKQGNRPQDTMIVGESAGGGLCLAGLLAIRDAGLPLPAAAVAISPWTDLTLTGESHRTRDRVCIGPPGMSQVCSRYYYGSHDPTLPHISPLYGDLHGLPPLLINAGDWDRLVDDSIRFARKAREAGVDVRLTIGEGMVHCYPLLAPAFPEATAAMDEICAFIQEHIGRREQPQTAADLIPA